VTDDEDDPPRERRGDVRHQGREAALQLLYQREIGRMDLDEALRTFWCIDREEPEPDARVKAFASELASGAVASLDRIDPLIEERAEHWRPERMAVIDRLILRLGVYELLAGEAPPNVVINEALELARTFSTDEAVGFINGLLDGIRKKLDEDRVRRPTVSSEPGS
jgi:transcription antitermination protein NusB